MAKARMIIEGNVQGVAYRVLVKQIARRMKIEGKVKNLDDGSVEIYCEADGPAIEDFTKKIDRKARNPEDVFSLNVEDIRVHFEGQEGYMPPAAELGAFEIDYEEEAGSAFERSNLERLETGSLLLSGLGDKVDGVGNKVDGLGGKIDLFRVESRENSGELKGEIKAFREESRDNFQTLDGKYHSVSEELGSINKNIARLAENISRSNELLVKLIQGYVGKKRA